MATVSEHDQLQCAVFLNLLANILLITAKTAYFAHSTFGAYYTFFVLVVTKYHCVQAVSEQWLEQYWTVWMGVYTEAAASNIALV